MNILMKWNDADKIAHTLQSVYGGTDPLSVRFTDLHDMVAKLPGFSDSPKTCSEETLETIQMAWYELTKNQ